MDVVCRVWLFSAVVVNTSVDITIIYDMIMHDVFLLMLFLLFSSSERSDILLCRRLLPQIDE